MNRRKHKASDNSNSGGAANSISSQSNKIRSTQSISPSPSIYNISHNTLHNNSSANNAHLNNYHAHNRHRKSFMHRLRNYFHCNHHDSKHIRQTSLLILVVIIFLFCMGYYVVMYIKQRSLQRILLPSSGFHPEWHPSTRSERFPNVEQRIKLYMSNFYTPPCQQSYSKNTNQNYDKEGSILYHVANQTSVELLIHHGYHGEENQHLTYSSPPDASNHRHYHHVATINTKITIDEPAAITTSGLRSCQKRVRNYCNDCVKLLDILSHILSNQYDENVQEKDESTKGRKQIQSNIHIRKSSQNHDPDVSRIKRPAIELSTSIPPILLQIGDDERSVLQHYPIPLFKKFRYATTNENLQHVVGESAVNCLTDGSNFTRPHLITQNTATQGEEISVGIAIDTTESSGIDVSGTATATATAAADAVVKPIYSPIIWPLNYKRHYEKVEWAPYHDIPWKRKLDKAVWRGAITGYDTGIGRNISKDKSDIQICQQVPRCNLILRYLHSPYVDAAGSKKGGSFPISHIENQSIYKGYIHMSSLLRYKAIVILEGNDVSSGLKWALLSRSVVLMPPPTKTSFAMEELLEEWVHYIPLHENLTNVEDQMVWIMNHDVEAQRIAERATLFIHDLLYHDDAEKENKAIQKEILERYLAFF